MALMTQGHNALRFDTATPQAETQALPLTLTERVVGATAFELMERAICYDRNFGVELRPTSPDFRHDAPSTEGHEAVPSEALHKPYIHPADRAYQNAIARKTAAL